MDLSLSLLVYFEAYHIHVYHLKGMMCSVFTHEAKLSTSSLDYK